MAIEYYNIEMASQKYVNFFQIYGCENKKFRVIVPEGSILPSCFLLECLFIWMIMHCLCLYKQNSH